jgi:putative glutamine amidotransferase
MKRPIIGFTALRSDEKRSRHHVLSGPYVNAVERAGGYPVVLPALPELAGEGLDLISGLLLLGGGDMEGKHFGQVTSPKADYLNPLRDEFELSVLKSALQRRMPVFGVCRGMQLLNVTLGGTLHQDIRENHGSELEHNREDIPDQIVHKVSIDPQSCLASILGSTQASVNSSHHQAIKDLSSRLRAVAWAPDGIIEAVEMCGPETGLVLAVQWHPERLFDKMPEQARLFQRFVKAAESYRDRRG